MKKLLKWALIIFAVFVAIGFFFNDDEDDNKNSTDVEVVQDSKQNNKVDLKVSDFKLNSNMSKAVKMLKSKGWKPGDGEDGEMMTLYNGGISTDLDSYGYEKANGNFEGYKVSFVQISSDEYNKLAHFRVTISTAFDAEELKQIASNSGAEKANESLTKNREKVFNEIQKKCLAQYGYSPFEEENENGESRNSIIFGYKNKNDDICKIEVKITDSSPIYAEEDYTFGIDFTLDYVSARYRSEEKLANDLFRDYYQR